MTITERQSRLNPELGMMILVYIKPCDPYIGKKGQTNPPTKILKKSKIKTIKGISKLFYWKWPCQGQYDGYRTPEYTYKMFVVHLG